MKEKHESSERASQCTFRVSAQERLSARSTLSPTAWLRMVGRMKKQPYVKITGNFA